MLYSPYQMNATHTLDKDEPMRKGHCKGTKKERKGASDWYRQQEEDNIRRIEAEWQAKQGQMKKQGE
jgi:hypothetical protein